MAEAKSQVPCSHHSTSPSPKKKFGEKIKVCVCKNKT
jgi:hypothetical protein